MALLRVSRRGKALILGLSVFFHSLPSWTASFDGQALNGLFDSGTGGGPLIRFSPKVGADHPIFVPPKAASSVVSFKDLRIPSHLFSREDNIAKTLVDIIDKTQKRMDLALYTISLPEVAEAIIRAKERGVAVRLIIDHNTTFPSGAAPSRPEELDLLIQRGVTIRTLRGGIMHNKFGLYDGELLSSGSFNWTVLAGTKHFENILFRGETEFLIGFRDYFNWMWMQATPLSGLSAEAEDPEPSEGSAPSLNFKGQPWPAFSFSPKGGTEDIIIKAIDLCGRSLDIAMFSFFSENIAQAVVRAKNRGVAVRVVMDKGNARNFSRGAHPASGDKVGTLNKAKKLLKDNGIDLKFSFGMDGADGVGILHHKFALLDGEMLQAGSFNYSANADRNNYENIIFSTSADEVRAFSREFEFLYNQNGGAPLPWE